MRPLLLLLLLPHVSGQIGDSQEACESRPGTFGYTSIEDMNDDAQAVLDNIANDPTFEIAETYVFNICPGQTLLADDDTLTPVLSGSQYVCGDGSNAADRCFIEGGTTQVQIERSTVDGYDIESIAFQGIDFSDFTQEALAGNAGDELTVTMSNVMFDVSTFI